jgi:topoisomerase-4 subunit B
VFESQTKVRLGSTTIAPDPGSMSVKKFISDFVKEELDNFLHKNPEISDVILSKITASEKERKELAGLTKQVREKAKKVNIHNRKLRDCRIHYNDPKGDRMEESCIFITEGDSASGSIGPSRNVMTQAIFSLRGKPLNTYGHTKSTIYKNEEIYNLMKALGIENGIEGLRHNKVVIATDADVDGFHIRNLVMTFFLVLFEQVPLKGHLYILETPLFRVRNKQQTVYCYTEEEKEKAMKKIKNHEITRFKGLGEISPKEFGQFIGDDIKLTKVTVEHLNEIKKSLGFYMGNNTPERKDYIMENLI